MMLYISTISPGLCSPPGTILILWSYQPSQVWLTITDPSVLAFAPTPRGVHARAVDAANAARTHANKTAEKRRDFMQPTS
jgi:hypothetical protein